VFSRKGDYVTLQLNIMATDRTEIEHEFPPPSVEKINFTSIFAKDFIHQVG